jgi:hypothetical protein
VTVSALGSEHQYKVLGGDTDGVDAVDRLESTGQPFG